MDDEIIPSGQLALRLEALQDEGVTDLTVEPCSTVTAKYVLSDSNWYMFTVSPARDGGAPVFSWHEVTVGAFDIYTRSYEHRGPDRGLSELLALDESEYLQASLRHSASALIAVHEVIAADIAECIEQAVNEASYAASERLTKLCQQPAVAPPIPEVGPRFEAFKAACQQRAPYCEGIQMDWGHNLGDVPGVSFGLAPGTPEQILYQADPSRSRQLYLNGFWTAQFCLEEDLLEQFPDDAWARLGARNAARDLLAIQRAGYELMQTRRELTRQEMDIEKREDLLLAIRFDRPLNADWDKGASELLQDDCVELFEKIKEYLNDLHPPRRAATRGSKRPPKPGALQATATS